MEIQPFPLDANRARLVELEAELARREADLAALKSELQRLQTRYLDEIGGLYAELSTLEAAVVEEEIRAGIRPPMSDDAEADASDRATDDDPDASTCSSPTAPSVDLKRMFRDLAKAVHPDRARDDAARFRSHRLMAEANRAYAERDEDRLRLILHAWEQSIDSLPVDDPEAERVRVQRKTAAIEERLLAIVTEVADLHGSAIWRLKGRIDDARAQGWDLFAEMVLQVRRAIARATSRLSYLRRNADVPVDQPVSR